MEKSLFVTDFDGTLLKDDKTIARKDLDTLSRLRKKNTITAIATGRSYYSFQRALKQINLDENELGVDYLIFSTGAGIMSLSGGTIIQSYSISKKDIKKISAYFDAGKFDYMIHKAIPDTPYFLYKFHGRENPDFHKRIKLYKEFSTPLNNGQALFETATQVLAIIPGRVANSQVKTIGADLSDYSVIHATSPLDHYSSWIEVFHKQVSKSQAGSWLAAMLNIDQENVISVGNDYNDQDLLEWSGKGYLVANAAQDLKPHFTEVPSNNHCGVSQAVLQSGLLN
jgi:Cof subfamily protein (haloacid dehalogenase superfamily)